MYEFPPEPWSTNTWGSIGVQVLWLLIGLVLCLYFLRRKRKARGFDAFVFLALAIVLTIVYLMPTASFPEQPSAHPVFWYLSWGMSALAILFHWGKLISQGNSKLALLSFSNLLGSILFILCIAPVPGGAREAARRTQCKNNLKQIGLALHNYHDTYERFPSHQNGKPPHSWRVDLLPYLDQGYRDEMPPKTLHAAYDFTEKWNTGSNENIAKTELPVYQCPSDPFMTGTDGFPFTAYAALVGTETIWQEKESLRIKDITDGTGNTLLVVEACGQRIPWAQPKDVQLSGTELMMNALGKELGRSEGALSSFHIGGIQALIGDGSVHFLSENTDQSVLKALSTASGGDVVGDF